MSSRAKRTERNQNKGRHPQQKNQAKKDKSPWRWLGMLSPTGKIATAIALFLTVSGSYYAFSPKISISSTGAIDPLNPYSTPFTVRNDSLLPLYSLKVKHSFRKMLSEKGGSLSMDGPTIETSSPPVPVLEAGEATTVFLPEMFKFGGEAGQLKHLDVSMFVSYRPALLPYNSKKNFRFSTIKTSDGVFHWISKAFSE